MVSRENLSTAERKYAWLLEEQAAVRRNIALVMRGAPLPELLTAVAEEVGRLVHADAAHVVRYVGDLAVVEAVWSNNGLTLPLGVRVPVAGHNIATMVKRTRRPARFNTYAHVSGLIAERLRDSGVCASVGMPVFLNDQLWGTIVVSATRPESLPSDTEHRIVELTEMMGASIWATQVRLKMSRLVAEQAALRRVATLVARGAPPGEILTAVTREVGQVLEVDATAIHRIEPDGGVTIVAGWNKAGRRVPLGGLGTVDDEGVAGRIFRSGLPARVEDFTSVPGPEAALARRMGFTAGAGGPIVVNGRLWGVIAAAVRTLPMPADAELRMSDFTELVATAISNAQARTELAASRARVVATSDETRRRLERDLHDGTQQRLVSLGLDLRVAQRSLPGDLQGELGHIADGLNDALEELREISRGIHPAILSQGGLCSALKTLARRAGISVGLEVSIQNCVPEPVEVAAYYVVSEALTNAIKHAKVSTAHVNVGVVDDLLHVNVHDDGVGGADPSRGSGLIGLTDRVEALGGTLSVHSPAGQGTLIHAELPINGG
ncbi:sensor histidine kinase [Dactylosporangium salmoneum]|uniref:histidine kinase n=1 Tax=Dactylosporangium salmoneum TaxID=53361 RepID=A0ABN3FYB2_9ACTN